MHGERIDFDFKGGRCKCIQMYLFRYGAIWSYLRALYKLKRQIALYDEEHHILSLREGSLPYG